MCACLCVVRVVQAHVEGRPRYVCLPVAVLECVRTVAALACGESPLHIISDRVCMFCEPINENSGWMRHEEGTWASWCAAGVTGADATAVAAGLALSRGSTDPLKSVKGFVRAPRKGSHADEELTEMEVR